jgi:hypothetical protein
MENIKILLSLYPLDWVKAIFFEASEGIAVLIHVNGGVMAVSFISFHPPPPPLPLPFGLQIAIEEPIHY